MSKRTDRRHISPQIKKTLTLILPITLIGVIMDRLAKDLAVKFLKGSLPVDLIPGVVRLNYAENTGAAFSWLSGQRVFFVILTVVVLIFAVWVICKGLLKNTLGYISMGMCISGAVGNFIDRLLQGFVVDMIEPVFVKFAVFNVADIFLTVGGILIAVYIVFFHYESTDKKCGGQAE